MTTTIRTALLLSRVLAGLLVLPVVAQANDNPQCRHSQPRDLALQLDGIRTVRFEIGNSKLRVEGAASPDATLRGRACASSEAALASLRLDQQRSGDTLTVTLRRETTTGGWFGNHYAYLDLSGQVPANVLVQAVVGSGDAWVTGVAAASADVGSGDAELRRVAGRVTAKVGSGDIKAEDIGALKVLSVGSGDVEARNVRGAAEIGSIGSGDVALSQVRGDVQVGSIGSGDLDLREIGGNVTVGSIGSGDLDIRGVDGNLTVSSKGSGDVSHRDVRGTVDVPRRR